MKLTNLNWTVVIKRIKPYDYFYQWEMWAGCGGYHLLRQPGRCGEEKDCIQGAKRFAKLNGLKIKKLITNKEYRERRAWEKYLR